MKVREAVPEDATAACLVMRRSIAELCAADHRNAQSHLPSTTLAPSQTAPTNPVTMTVMTALKV